MAQLKPGKQIPHIILYIKTGCQWGQQVIDFLKSVSIPFETRNMTEIDEYRLEAIEKSGQAKCPTLDIDGHMLPNSDAKQIEEYLKTIEVIE
jgi:monothiol glutaredoxin